MKKSLFALCVLIFALFSIAANAADEAPCGMELSEDTGSYVVSFASGEICEEDLVFQGLYLMFEDTLKDPWTNTLVSFFVSDDVLNSEFTEFADSSINVSDTIHYVLSAMAIAGWMLLTPLLAVKGYKLALTLKRTGRFDFEESQGDTVKFISFVSFLIILALPVGLSTGENRDKPPLMLGQVLAITMALPANMGGNYFYSSYLSSTETASTDVPINDELLLPVGQGIANTLIEGRLCEINTRQALVNLNAKSGSDFFKSSTFGEVFDYDHESVEERVDTCLSYTGDIREGEIDDTISAFSLNKYALSVEPQCSKIGYGNGYDSSTYGQPHSCLSIGYSFGEDKFANFEDLLTDGEESWSFDDNIEPLRTSFSAPIFYERFKREMKGKIKTVLDNETLTPNERFVKINSLVLESSESVFGSALRNAPLLIDGSNEVKQARHVAVAGFLLGGTIEMSSWDSFWGSMGLEIGSTWTHTKGYPSLTKDDEIVYGLEVLLNDAKETAELIREYECAVNWTQPNNQNARDFILSYNQASGSQVESTFGSKEPNLQCVKFLSQEEWGDTDTNRYVTYATDSPYVYSDIKEDETGKMVKGDLGDGIESARNKIETEVIPELRRKIQLNQFLLAGYTAAVKKAVTDSLKSSLSLVDAEEQRDVALRPRGWGVFGGALLYTGQTQASSMHMSRSLDNVMSVAAAATGDNYVSTSAFEDITSDQEKTIAALFADYPTNSLFATGPNGTRSYAPNSSFSEDADDESTMQYFMSLIENLLLSPMDHIKEASGMPMNKSLSYGLQECFDGGYENCVSGTKHPVVAFSNFGNEMINNMMTLMLTTEIIMAANRIELGTSEEEGSVDGDKKKKGIFKKASEKIKKVINGIKNVVGGVVVSLVKIVLGAIQLAAVILNFLKPLFVTLLVVGIVFAYIIPMMSFLFGFMISVMFLVSIFTVAVVMPFYIFSKFSTIEKDYQNGFKMLWQDLGGTYLTPAFFSISATLSWTLIVIILYALNVSFFLLHHGLGAASESSSFSFFTVLIFNVLIYVVYFLAVFILFRFGLGLMKSMTDTFKEKLNLKKGDDESYINSLGFEQYVKANVMSSLAQMPSKFVEAIANHKANGGYDSMADMRRNVEAMEESIRILGLNRENAERRGAEDAAKMARAGANSQPGQPHPTGGAQPGNDSDPRVDVPPQGSEARSGDDKLNETSPQEKPQNLVDDESQLGEPERDSTGKPKVQFTPGDATDNDDKK